MELHTLGIDLGKTVFHLVGLNLRGEVVVRKKFSRTQTVALHRQRTRRIDRHGSMRRCAFSWASPAGTETRGATDARLNGAHDTEHHHGTVELSKYST